MNKRQYHVKKNILPKQNENRIGPNNDTNEVNPRFLAKRGKNKY